MILLMKCFGHPVAVSSSLTFLQQRDLTLADLPIELEQYSAKFRLLGRK